MPTDYRKAKVTIEFEERPSVKVEFVAYLRTRERVRFDPPIPFNCDGKFMGMKLPEPPRWQIEGTTVGAMTMTLQNPQ